MECLRWKSGNVVGLSLNDDSRKTCNAEDEEKDTDKEGDNVAAVVEATPIVATDWNPFNGVCAPLGYTFIRKLAFIWFGPTSKHFLPILKPIGASELDKD